MQFVGIDPHASQHTVCVLGETGEVFQQFQVPASEVGFRSLDSRLRRQGAQPRHLLIALEASGVYWVRLADFLTRQGYGVSIQPPAAIRWFARSNFLRAKTDVVDARTLAEYARLKRPPRWQGNRDPRFHELREWVEYRHQLVHDQTQWKNRLHRARVGLSPPEVITHLQEHLSTLRVQLREVDTSIRPLVQDLGGWALIEEVPGVGLGVVAAFIALVQDPSRFPSEKHLRSYLGLVPRVRQSGNRPPQTHLSRMGNPRFRAILWMATLVATRYHPDLKAYYRRKRDEGKPHKVAMVGAMNKLTRILFALWRRHYQPEVKNLPTI